MPRTWNLLSRAFRRSPDPEGSPAPLRIAHLSDLHLGRSPEQETATLRLVQALERASPDAVVVSGDVTHRGRACELAAFEALFEPWERQGRLVVVPGNHDRMGIDLGRLLMPEGRVHAVRLGALHLIRLDSTLSSQEAPFGGAVRLLRHDLAAVATALDAAPPDAAVGVVLHHHVSPLPADTFLELLVSWLPGGLAEELPQSTRLLALLRGRCDFLLHGHRHVPGEQLLFPDDPRPLRMLNAGSSPQLGRFRLLCRDARGWTTGWSEAREPDRPQTAVAGLGGLGEGGRRCESA